MARLNGKIPGNLSLVYSGVRPEDLGATQYTLVTIVCDKTGSLSGFENDLMQSIKTAITACKKSPRAENLLIRFTTFNNSVTEEHGFKLLSQIDVDNDYKLLNCDGMTALYDASYEGVGATLEYAKTLVDQDFDCNGIVFIITDGADNKSVNNVADVNRIIGSAVKEEKIESLLTILVGINDGQCKQYLDDFKDKAGITQFVSVGEITPGKLAKLAAFVSKSVSSQSQSLGTGGPSQPLTF